MGRASAGVHRDRLGGALGELGGGRFLLLAQPDGYPHGLDGNAGGAGQEPGRRCERRWRKSARPCPSPCAAIDSDNGSEFINAHLWRYCQAHAIQFTRGRPYKKDDNAHIEQKNWTHVRRLLGYLRYDSGAAREAMNELYRKELRLFQNLFLPSVKLEKKERIGSRLRRHYQAPCTPWQRVVNSAVADPERVAELRCQRQRLDPFQLSSAVQAKLEGIFRLSHETVGSVRRRSTPGVPASPALRRPAAEEPKRRARAPSRQQPPRPPVSHRAGR